MPSRQLLLLFTVVSACFAQLTADQKRADMRMLIDLHAKNYAPYEWKKTALKFDAAKAGPWLEKAAATKTDLEFYDVCIEYTASLFDAHDAFRLPSSFSATAGLTVDIFEGKVLIDSIDEARLPPAEFPAKVGDELVSVDGKKVEDWIKETARYAIGGSRAANERDAATMILQRSQAILPHAHKALGDAAEMVIRDEAGETRTLKAPWRKRGTPLESIAWPVAVTNSKPLDRRAAAEASIREYLDAWRNLRVDTTHHAMVRGYGVREPIFAMPEGFEQTAGQSRFDLLFGGILPFDGKRIGFVRIPSMSAAHARAFRDVVANLRERTDALVVDVTRNPGGELCATENMAVELMTGDWKVQGAEIRAALRDILNLQSLAETARTFRLEEDARYFEMTFEAMQRAYTAGRNRTEPIPYCTVNDTRKAVERAYNKPVLVLIDEFSTSAAEHLAAMLQDSDRAKLFGKRTTGAGGAVSSIASGVYSEGRASITWTLTARPRTVAASDFPEAPYIENVGVRPDIEFEMNTRENLVNKGKLYTDAFLKAARDLIP